MCQPLSALSLLPIPACSYVGSLVWLVLASALLVQACMYWTRLINPTIIFTSIVSPMVGGRLGSELLGVLWHQSRHAELAVQSMVLGARTALMLSPPMPWLWHAECSAFCGVSHIP
jgi:hypothetical protein